MPSSSPAATSRCATWCAPGSGSTCSGCCCCSGCSGCSPGRRWASRRRPRPSRRAEARGGGRLLTLARMDRPVLLFDGHCRFCLAQAERLRRWAGGDVELLSFRESGALERFPQVDAAACERAIQLVLPDGRVRSGIDAVLGVLALRPALAPLAALGRLPGVHALLAAGYRMVADNRFALGGRTEACAE